MTVSAETGRKEPKAARLDRLTDLIAPLATAVQQLQLDTDDVLAAVREALEKKDV
jgi:hypothetical protein